jgi:hypothetical protein
MGDRMMCSQLRRRILLALVILLAFGLSVDEASGQRRRTKRSRRATNPVAAQPVTPASAPTTQASDPQIISTADQQANDQGNSPEINGQVSESPRRTNRKRAAEADDADSVRRTVDELSTQVTKLTDKLSQMEQQQRTLVDMERLSRAEVRAEALRTQLRDVQEKEGAWQARIEQIDYSLKPDNIERSVSSYGSTRPEEAREARRRQLESEKVRARTQIDLLASSRQRLETAVINADLEVDKLRRRIEEADEAEEKAKTTEGSDKTDKPAPAQPSTEEPGPGPPSGPPR